MSQHPFALRNMRALPIFSAKIQIVQYHGLLKLEDGTLVLSRRVMACRVDFNHNFLKKGQSIEL